MNVQKLYNQNSESTIGLSSDDHQIERWIVFSTILSVPVYAISTRCIFFHLFYIIKNECSLEINNGTKIRWCLQVQLWLKQPTEYEKRLNFHSTN